MTHLDEQFKEGIFENSEFKLLKNLIDVLNEQHHSNASSSLEETAVTSTTTKKETTAVSAASKRAAQKPPYLHEDKKFLNVNKLLKDDELDEAEDDDDENDDEDIVVVDGVEDDSDFDRGESQDETEYFADEHDHDDDVQCGGSGGRKNNKSNRIHSARTLTNEHEPTGGVDIEPEENTPLHFELLYLEKFKNCYQTEYNLNENARLHKQLDRLFTLVVNKRICSRAWRQQRAPSSKNVYLILFCLRILLRDTFFQRKFLTIESGFASVAKLFERYVSTYASVYSQLIIHSHILDQLLNILTKVLFSEPLLAELEIARSGSGGTSRQGSAASSSTANNNKSASNNLVKRLSRRFFSLNVHVSIMQLLENSNELSLVHPSLNLLVQVCSIDVENRGRLATDLHISDQLLLILQEYDEDSKKLAVKLLCLLCIEDKIKSEVSSLDGIQVLLSLLDSQNNLDILWNVIWCLVQLSSYDDNKREIRLMGGIPLVLSILCDKNLDVQSSSETATTSKNGMMTSNGSSTGSLASNQNIRLASENDVSDKRLKAKLQVQAACCALVGELAFNETNSYHIVNTNGVYLVASKLLIPVQLVTASGLNDSNGSSRESSSSTHPDRNKEVERLHCNVWRTLRLLFSTERHRALLKKLIPFSMFEQFVDVGNYKKDIKLYQPLVESFYRLGKDEANTIRAQIQSSNQIQAPKNYINEYEVYEIIGSGAFGRVHKVKKKNSSVFLAMKEINTFNLSSMKDKSLGEIVNEVTIIRNNLKHPNIVRYLKTFKENDSLYIVMELIDGTPLSQHLRTLKERQELWAEDKVWNLFIQIVLALKYLHKEKNIVHRDLTGNNIMLSENDRITITDFGLAKLIENDCSKMLSVVGTMLYSCPEIIKNEPYNERADVWALGCILYELCCLEPPFCTSNMLALATKITQADYDQERIARNGYSQLVTLVVQSCLVVEPTKRADIVGVAALIAEKILTYTDAIRYKCVSLEKKLEKEKNKTQKLYCNKQDLNYQQRTHLVSKTTGGEATTAAAAGIEPEENTMPTTTVTSNNPTRNSSTNISPISSATTANKPPSSQKPPPTPTTANDSNSTPSATQQFLTQQAFSKVRSNSTNSNASTASAATTTVSSTMPIPIGANNTVEIDSKQQESFIIDSLDPKHNTCSPNAKLPPLRNPKSKLIMKNMQIKQSKQAENSNNPQQSSVTTTPTDNTGRLSTSAKTSSTINSELSSSALTNSATAAVESANEEAQEKTGSGRIQRSSSSSVLEKRSSQSKKSRPNSANSGMAPVYKKLRPVQDPIIQILDQIHKILFIAQLPPTGKKNFKRKIVDRYKRSLFSNKRGSMQIKTELMKLIKNSNELIDIEMIGLKNFQPSFNTSDCNSSATNNQNQQHQSSFLTANSAAKSSTTSAVTLLDNNYVDSSTSDLEMILNQNGITYEQMQTIIEDLLVENNYYLDYMKKLREELPSID